MAWEWLYGVHVNESASFCLLIWLVYYSLEHQAYYSDIHLGAYYSAPNYELFSNYSETVWASMQFCE